MTQLLQRKALISIVVPVFNEEANIDPFYETVTKTIWKMRSDIHHFPIMSMKWCHGPHNKTAKKKTVRPSTE